MIGDATASRRSGDGGIPFEELEVGLAAESTTTITEAHLVLFAGLTGDFNPVHVNERAASRSRFGGRIAPGMLTAGLVSAVLGTKLPGPGSVYVGQTLRFEDPVYPGDTVTARVEIVEIVPDRRRVRLRTTCFLDDEERVLDGEAEVWIPESNPQQED